MGVYFSGIFAVDWGVGLGVESFDMSPESQGSPTVSVPYLTRPKLGFKTVSTDCGSWDGKLVRTREVMSCPTLYLSVDYMLLRDNMSQELRYFFNILK